jgi:hypothetical protein
VPRRRSGSVWGDGRLVCLMHLLARRVNDHQPPVRPVPRGSDWPVTEPNVDCGSGRGSPLRQSPRSSSGAASSLRARRRLTGRRPPPGGHATIVVRPWARQLRLPSRDAPVSHFGRSRAARPKPDRGGTASARFRLSRGPGLGRVRQERKHPTCGVAETDAACALRCRPRFATSSFRDGCAAAPFVRHLLEDHAGRQEMT